MRLRFLTGNAGKVREMQQLLGPDWSVEADGRGYPEIQADTLEAVAQAGAEHLIAQGVEAPFVLEDSGLFIDALRGFPGVYSRHALDTVGCDGILRLMSGVTDRRASFRTCLLYVAADGTRQAFEGRAEGTITHALCGAGGFGFDPVFRPLGHGRTFAEMDAAEKGALSHRGQSVRAFAEAMRGA